MNDMTPAQTGSAAALPLSSAATDTPFRWLRSEIDRLFETFGRPGTAFRFGEFAPAPALDMTENDGSYRITVELPGMKDDDVDVSVADRVLTVSGEKRHDEERHEGGTLLSERRYGASTRSLRLPEDADPAQIDAHLKKGVLIVQVRKDENAAGRVRRIEVKKD